MKVIKKKTWPELFEAVLSGEKKFDLRLADEEFDVGDVLVLEEWSPEEEKYTGRKIEKKISFVMKINEVDFWSEDDVNKYGYVVVSLD